VRLGIVSQCKKMRSGLKRLRAAGLANEDLTPDEGAEEGGDGVTRANSEAPAAAPPAHLSSDTDQGREERVAELRQRVKSGSYEIPVPQLVRILASRLFGKG
jgi:anti-sigma28 factor (negative regulator of flagellin synthesis)